MILQIMNLIESNHDSLKLQVLNKDYDRKSEIINELIRKTRAQEL